MGVRKTVSQRSRNRSPALTLRLVLSGKSTSPATSPIVARLRFASA